MPAQRGAKSSSKAAQINLAERDKKIWELVASGRTMPSVAEEMKVTPDTVRHVVDKGLAQFSPEAEVETYRRILVDQTQQLIQELLPHALGKTEVVELVKEGDSQVPTRIPIRLADQVKAVDALLKVYDRMAKWSGVEAEVVRKAKLAEMSPDDPIYLSDQALMEFVSKIEAEVKRG